MLTKNSRQTQNFRDCSAKVEHLDKDFHKGQERVNEIFGKEYWFEKRDRLEKEKNKKT